MTRKWSLLAVTAASVTLMAAGISVADDEDNSPLHQIMTKVQAKYLAVSKAVRTPIAFKKAGNATVSGDAQEIVKLLKEARPIKDASVEQKKPFEQWTGHIDATAKATEDFAKVASEKDQAEVKKEFRKVTASCAECHKVFRVEEDEGFE